jgi:hypothetical protein
MSSFEYLAWNNYVPKNNDFDCIDVDAFPAPDHPDHSTHKKWIPKVKKMFETLTQTNRLCWSIEPRADLYEKLDTLNTIWNINEWIYDDIAKRLKWQNPEERAKTFGKIRR